MRTHTIDIKEGDKFVAYHRPTMRKSLSGGVCKAVRRYNKRKKTYSPSVSYCKESGNWSSVNAIDAQGNQRLFRSCHQWGFLKR
jgi:hypothetical protein